MLKAGYLAGQSPVYSLCFENLAPERESRRPIPGVVARYPQRADVTRLSCAGRRGEHSPEKRRKPLRARPQHFGAWLGATQAIYLFAPPKPCATLHL